VCVRTIGLGPFIWSQIWVVGFVLVGFRRLFQYFFTTWSICALVIVG